MSTTSKLVNRLSIPSDLTWEELVKILDYYGFEMKKTGKTGGSRRKFFDKSNSIIILHKPHPANIVKRYAIRQVIQNLKEKGKIKDE